MPDVAADTTRDVPTDAPVTDVTTDNLTPHVPAATTDDLANEAHSSKGSSKRKSISHTQPNVKRSKSSADDELMSTGVVHALVCMLMMLVQGGSGCSVGAPDEFMRIALTMMM